MNKTNTKQIALDQISPHREDVERSDRETRFLNWLLSQFEKAERAGHPHAEYVDVGPAEARVCLSLSGGNRNESANFVQSYSRDAQAGKWVVTHQGFAFDVRQVFFDGHHRCKMIIESGVTVRVAISFGLPEEAVGATDTGKVRTVANVLELTTRMASSRSVVATIAAALKVERGRMSTGFTKLTASEVIAALDSYGEAIEAIRTSGVWRQLPSSFWGPIAFAYPINPSEIMTFAQKVAIGADLERDEPAFAMRAYILKKRAGDQTTGQANANSIIQHTLYAIRAHLEGRRLSKIQVREPELILADMSQRRAQALRKR